MNNRNFSKAVEAVSPVVATLLLVLVAAGAAIGFGVFLNGFQDKAQDNVNTEAANGLELRIAGSSTVHEFTKQVLTGVKAGQFSGAINTPAFEAWSAAQGTPVKVTNDEGGSGAGRKALGLCQVDIGASSSDMPATEFAAYPDCNKDGVKDVGVDVFDTIIGYDAVAVTYGSGNAHCSSAGMSINELQITELYKVNGFKTPGTRSSQIAITDAAAGAAGATTLTSATNLFTSATVGRVVSGTGLAAGTIIKSVASDGSSAAISKATTAAVTTANANFIVGGGSGYYTWADLVAAGICAAGTDTDADVVLLSSRLDNSGTEDGFCDKVLKGLKADGVHCDKSSNQLLMDNVNPQDGNPGIATWLLTGAGKSDGLSFMGYGTAANTAGLTIAKVADAATPGDFVAPSASTIKAGAAGPSSTAYGSTRTLHYYTVGEPSGAAKIFLDYITSPNNNLMFTSAAGYVSYY